MPLALACASIICCMSAASFLRIGDRGRRQLMQHAVDRVRGQRCFILEHIGGVIRITQQLGAIGAQLDDFSDGFGGVEFTAPAAAHGRLVQSFAHGAVLQLRQRRLAGGVQQRDHPFAFLAARLGGFGGDRDLRVRQTIQLGAIVDHDGGGVVALEHQLTELRRQRGDLFVQRAQLGFLRVGEIGAGAHEVGVIALQQAQRLRIELQRLTLVVELLDAREQCGVQVNRIVVRRQLRRHLGLRLLDDRIGVRGAEH